MHAYQTNLKIQPPQHSSDFTWSKIWLPSGIQLQHHYGSGNEENVSMHKVLTKIVFPNEI